MNISTKKDWFEFILDLNLLEKHLTKNDQIMQDPSGCSLIVQFLYHANVTEQYYNINLNGNSNPTVAAANAVVKSESNAKLPAALPQNLQIANNESKSELKINRIQLLHILAIKTAAILDWNLVTFEKEIPIAVMSDLLRIFLRVTMDGKEPTNLLHSTLDISKLKGYCLFALQLLHRWCLRVVLFSKFPKKPPTKLVPINLPGCLNPSQHMKDANDSILKVLTNNVLESVEFLENCLKSFSDRTTVDSISIPTIDCFKNVNQDIDWECSISQRVDQIQNYILHDLALFYFQIENYQKAYEYFLRIVENREKFKGEDQLFLDKFNVYANELDGYLLACRGMLNLDMHTSDDNRNLNINRLIDESLNNDFKNLFELLLEDNKKRKLSMSYRLSIEKYAAEKKASKTILDQIFSSNLVCIISESSNYHFQFNYNFDQLHHFLIVANSTIDSLAHLPRARLITFIQLNHAKLKTTTINPISPHLTFVRAHTQVTQDQEMTQDDSSHTPSSPPASSSLFNTMNLRDNGLITYAKHSLQTCDPVVIKNCISKYNLSVNQSQNPLPTLATLRYFWPQWDKAASKILSPKDGQQLINASTLGQLIKTSSPNDMDFFFICYAKVIQLCDVKKFECATKLLRLINVKLNSKIITNLMLYLSIHKYLSQDFDFNNNNNTNNTTNQETLVKMCKTFLLDSKKDPDMSLEIFVSVVGFLLTSGEYALLLSNEVNFIVAPLHQSNFHQQQKRQNLNLNQQSPIAVFFFTLGKNLAKLCLELVQSDKSNIRKTARDLWDMFVELFSDPTIQQQQQQQQQLKAQKRSHLDAGLESDSPAAAATAFANRKLLRTFLRSAKSQLVKNILISLFSTLYNIGDAAASNEIFSEFRHLWPSSLASAGSLNINAINDLLTVLIQSDSLQNANELNCQWLRTQADLFVTRANYCDAFRLFIELIVYETKYFFKYRSASSPKEHVSNEDRFIDEKTIKSMIKTAGLLNKHTHAAILCQFLTKNQDYSTAFRFLQDGTMITLTGDEMDLLYKCVWDMTLLEYLTNLNSIRGFISKRNVCLKLCTNPNMNPSIFEIFQKTVESKKKNFFKQLISYYFLYD